MSRFPGSATHQHLDPPAPGWAQPGPGRNVGRRRNVGRCWNVGRRLNAGVRLLAMLLAVAVLQGCTGEPAGESAAIEPRQERTLPVQALEVGFRDLSRVIRLSAVVEPRRSVELAARTEGVLTEIRVEEGDRIEPGQLLARIDVREQRAELQRALARLEEQQAAYRRLARLRENDYIDAASYEATRAALAIAEAEVELWRTRIDFGSVEAPIRATVVARHFEPGEAVSRHQSLFTLADLSTQVLRLGVSELDVAGIDIGLPVEVSIDALPEDEPLTGRVRRIFPAAEPLSRLVTVEVELQEAEKHGVRPGFLGRAVLQVDQRQGVLAIPLNTLARNDDNAYVMVIDGDDRLERRTIVPGITRGMWREVLAGLAPGDRIVASNPMDLTEGAAVRIVGWAG